MLTEREELELLRLRKRKAMAASSMPDSGSAPSQVDTPPTSQYSAANPAPGAEIRAPFGDTPWYEMGDEYQANQAQIDATAPQPVPMDMVVKQALGRGAADVAGAPGDIPAMIGTSINNMANASGLSEALFGRKLGPFTLTEPLGSENIAQAFTQVAEEQGYPVFDPEQLDDSAKSAYDVTRFASGGGASGLTAASRAGKATTQLGKAFTQPYEQGATRQVMQDIVAGGGAGLGSNIAEDITEKYPDKIYGPTAQFVAPILGGMAGSAGFNVASAPARGMYNRTTVDLPNVGKVDRRTAEGASEALKHYADDAHAAANKIRASTKEAKDAGLTPLTTGLAADDVGLAFVEKRHRMQDPLEYARKDQAIRTDMKESVKGLRDPDAAISAPQEVARRYRAEKVAEAQTKSDKALSDVVSAEQRKIDLERETDALSAPIKGQKGQKPYASQELDEQVSGTLKKRTDIKNKGFEEAAGTRTADISPIADSIDKVEAEVNKLGFENSGIPKGFVNKVRSIMPGKKQVDSGVLDESGKALQKEVSTGGTGQAKLKDISEVRAQISDAIDRARKAGNIDLQKNLQTLKDDINKMIDNTASFDDAQKYYREEYAPFFGEGYGKQWRNQKYRAEKGTGMDDSAMTARFFLEHTPDRAAHLKKIVDIAPSPKEAEAAVERYMAAELANRLGNTNNPRVVADWIAERAAQLDQFPNVKAKFQQFQKQLGSKEIEGNELRKEIKKLTKAFRDAENNIMITERRIDQGVLGTVIKADPKEYIGKIMGKADTLQQIDELKSVVKGNSRAERGLKRAVTEYVIDTVSGTNVKMTDTGEGPILYSQIVKVMKKNEDALAKIYSPEEMNVLRRAQKQLGAYGNLARKGDYTGSDTSEKIHQRMMSTALETGLRLKYGVLKAGGLMKTLRNATDLLPEGHMSKVDRLVTQAMLDPELAAHLLDAPPATVGKKAWNRELFMLMGVSSGGREVLDEDTPEE